MVHNSFPAQTAASRDRASVLHRFVGGAIVLLWGYVVLPELGAFVHLLHTLSRFNIILLVGVALVLLAQSIRHWKKWGFSIEPTFHVLPLLVMFGAAIASIAARWRLDLEQLAVVGVVVGAYGLIGLFCHPRPWRRGIPFMGGFTVLIVLLLLEFTDLGHLARTAIAEVVEHLLKPYRVDAISSEDILVLSTGVAFIDLPCSGFKGIEIGSLLFVLASLLERKQMGLRWLLVGLANVAMLVTANIARILVLVVLTFVVQQPTLAEVLHVPLGVCGFAIAYVATLYLLRFVPRQAVPLSRYLDNPSSPVAGSAAAVRNAALTLSLLVGLALVPQPAGILATATHFDELQWSTPMQAQSIDLTPYEQTFFNRYPGVVAQKQAFQLNGVSGSMMFVASPTWQAHHTPELCFTANGLQIDGMEKATITPLVTGRWLSLNQGQQQAAYWFQSSERTTDDYLDRVWSEITRRDPHWTLVSILFDQPVSTSDPAVETMLDAVHSAIAQAMI